jgi:tetratricopeptide (TPR) repeat protein
MQRGNNYYALEMFPQAISDFDKAIKMGLKISKIYYNRGNAHFRAKNYESALEDYNKVLGFDSTDLETLNNRAMAYDKLGDTLKAKEDRQRLAILSGNANKFPDLNSLHFVTYVADGGEYAINMPDNWLKFVNNTDDVKEMIITHDSIESFEEPYAVGIKLSFNKNMFKNFKVKTVDDIMQFWKDSDDLNAKDYFDYRRMEETYFTRKNGYKGIQRTIQIHIKKEMIPLVLYEYAVAKEDVLFYAYFQAPVSEWGYYKQIFDKAIKSLAIK